MTTLTTSSRPQAAAPDLKAMKAKQQFAWSSGDDAVVGVTLQIVGETLAESMDLRAGQTVLDVAAGNGNFTLAAAQPGCAVTSTDEALGTEGGKALSQDIVNLIGRFNRSGDATMVVPSEYLDAIVTRR